MDANPIDTTTTPVAHGPVIWIVLTYVALFFLLSAFSAPAPAQLRAGEPQRTHQTASNIVVPMETLKVVPQPEELPAPAKGRWQRFDEALNAGRTSRGHRVVEWRENDGVRMACYQPCANNCCVSSGAPSVVFGRGFGR